MGNKKRIGLNVFLAETLLGLGICAYGYANYLMTDIVRLDVEVVSAILTAGSVIGIICNIFGGAVITNFKSRFGKYRPWLIGLNVMLAVCVFLLMFDYGSPILTIAVIAIAYAGVSVGSTLGTAPRYGLYAAIGGEDNTLRNDLNGKSWAGFALASVLSGAALLPMVYAIAGTRSEAYGWRVGHLVLSVLTVIGLIMFWNLGKDADPDNRSHAEEKAQENVKFSAMLKAVFSNRPALAVALGDCIRYTGSMLMFSLMFYQAIYVVGDYLAMTVATALMAFGSIGGGMIAPYVIKMLGGRKRTAIASCVVSAVVYALFLVFGKSFWGYCVLYTIASLTSSFVDTVDSMLYIDAGEYWLDKTGEDTRPFLMSMQPITSAVGGVFSGILFGVALKMCHYDAELSILEGSDATIMTAWLGLGMAVSMLLFVVVLLILHNVNDKTMEELIVKNAEAGHGMEGI